MANNEIVPIILAAGRGSRLGQGDTPKTMALVAGKPLMQLAVESLLKTGFASADIIVVIGFRGEVIKSYFGADLGYVLQPELNGNAGALDAFLSENKEIDKHVLVIQGDDANQATPENLQQLIHFHFSRQADISILTVNHPDPESHLIEYISDRDGRVVEIIPRESIDSNGQYTAGIYIFSGPLLAHFLPILKETTPEGKELGIINLIQLALNSDQRVFRHNSNQEYVSVNTPKGLRNLRQKATEP